MLKINSILIISLILISSNHVLKNANQNGQLLTNLNIQQSEIKDEELKNNTNRKDKIFPQQLYKLENKIDEIVGTNN